MTVTSSNPLLESGYVPTLDSRVLLKAKDGDVPIPVLATGTWSWGDKAIWQYRPEDLDNIKSAFREALVSQGGFFDTAEFYGNGESERIIKQCMDTLSDEERKQIIIATKWFPMPTPLNWFFFTPGVVKALKNSLARLGLESVDLYQIHGPIGYHSWEAQGRELAKCVHLGLAKAVGVSNFSRAEVIKMDDILKRHGVPLASNQIEFNLLRQSPLNNGLLEEMRKRGIICLAYSPLGQGRLSGKYSAAKPPPKGRKFSNIPMQRIDPLVEQMRKIAEDRGVSVSAIAINWVLSKGAIPLGGAKNAKQAKQNAQALGFRLTEEETARLEALGAQGTTSITWQHG